MKTPNKKYIINKKKLRLFRDFIRHEKYNPYIGVTSPIVDAFGIFDLSGEYYIKLEHTNIREQAARTLQHDMIMIANDMNIVINDKDIVTKKINKNKQ